MGETGKQIPYSPVTAGGAMDARAQAVHENAKIAKVQTAAAATGSNDFCGLAGALGEQTAPGTVAQPSTEFFDLATVPVKFTVSTPRERMPRSGKTLERDMKMTRRFLWP